MGGGTWLPCALTFLPLCSLSCSFAYETGAPSPNPNPMARILLDRQHGKGPVPCRPQQCGLPFELDSRDGVPVHKSTTQGGESTVGTRERLVEMHLNTWPLLDIWLDSPP
jgi:hypothetical protein